MKPHKCPVCNGTGWVPGNFYGEKGWGKSMPCRACGCSGIVWEPLQPIINGIGEIPQCSPASDANTIPPPKESQMQKHPLY